MGDSKFFTACSSTTVAVKRVVNSKTFAQMIFSKFL